MFFFGSSCGEFKNSIRGRGATWLMRSRTIILRIGDSRDLHETSSFMFPLQLTVHTETNPCPGAA